MSSSMENQNVNNDNNKIIKSKRKYDDYLNVKYERNVKNKVDTDSDDDGEKKSKNMIYDQPLTSRNLHLPK